MKKALITGITGQDGFYLTKLLIKKGYKVFGFARRNSQMSWGSLESLEKKEFNAIEMRWGDIIDHTYMEKIIQEIKPDEIYHLAAQSFVGLSFENPKLTYDVNISGTLNLLNAVKEFSPKSKVYFAATSELYGKVKESPQNEKTPFYPRSPYGISKLAGFWTMINYRDCYDLICSNGILFTHESEMRGSEFVTRKISRGIANIVAGKQKLLELGNLNAKRDWGHAEDYVYAMWQILQEDKYGDYVIATGENRSVREFVEAGFKAVKISITWEGEGINEIGKHSETKEILIKINPKFFRPTDVEVLLGDASKAKAKFGWEPKVTFDELVKRMVKADIERIKC